MNYSGFDLRYERRLWLGYLSTKHGLLELVLTGTEASPDLAQVEALRVFCVDIDDRLDRLRRTIRFRFLWHPIRLAVTTQNRVGVQFRNKITGSQQKVLFEEPPQKNLRAVPGAAAYSIDGKVAYNLLTPHMQAFMGRCIGAVKKAGIPARGTGEFSIVVGDLQRELVLDPFYPPDDEAAAIASVVAKARELVAQG